MEMPASHEILISNLTGLDNSRSPKQSAFTAFDHWLKTTHSVDQSLGTHPAPGFFISKNMYKVA
jgi:hypothetical protein